MKVLKVMNKRKTNTVHVVVEMSKEEFKTGIIKKKEDDVWATMAAPSAYTIDTSTLLPGPVIKVTAGSDGDMWTVTSTAAA